MDTLTSVQWFIFYISQLAVVFSHEHFSKFQFRTHPKSLYECNNTSVTFGEVSHEQEKQHVISYLDCFRGNTIKAIQPNITQEQINQFNEVLRRMTTDHWRVKRQSGRGNNRMRREVRILRPEEWRRVTQRFNAIFRSGRLGEIVAFHNGAAIGGAHGGPAFLSWHRILLLWIEFYLGLPVPYWDSSLDFHITDPTRSILWTRHFFGNGRGTVRTGPFSGFTEPGGNRISRGIGQSGTLIARENIESLMSRNRNWDLIYTDLISMEGYHNGPHVWVGRTLQGIVTAPSDPCFWFHHSFIDKLWRDVQRRMPNPEEYPFRAGTNPAQRPRENMVMFPVDPRYPLLNEDGYMNWVARQAVYQRSPGQATQRSQCRNPAWRNRQVLNWDNQRRICVTGEGRPGDFNTPPDPQANRMSSSAFNSGHNSDIQFISPLTDRRTILQPSVIQDAVFPSARNTVSRNNRNGVFNDNFVSEITDVRTSADRRASLSPNRVARPVSNTRSMDLLVNVIIQQLQNRQQELLAQIASNARSSSFVNRNLIGQTSGTDVPVVSNIFPGRQSAVIAPNRTPLTALLARVLMEQQRNNRAANIGSIDITSPNFVR